VKLEEKHRNNRERRAIWEEDQSLRKHCLKEEKGLMVRVSGMSRRRGEWPCRYLHKCSMHGQMNRDQEWTDRL
jgi:hypothetical protein